MKNYYRVMLGKGSVFAEQCFAGGFIGVDFDIVQDLTHALADEWRDFNKAFVPVWLAANPGRSKIAAGLACGAVWTVCKGILKDDIVLCPDGMGRYRVGDVVGDYSFAPGEILPHRRAVHWHDFLLQKSAMSDELRRSAGSIGTVSNVSVYRDEIERLLGGGPTSTFIVADPTVEDPFDFVMEKHLEDFLVQNWSRTIFGKGFDIFEEEGEKAGQQYPTDTGPIDILAVSKDKKELLVLELKKGRASDVVVGQVLRYMGYVIEQLAEKGQTVKGAIIALEDDQRLRRALAATPNITFYRYRLSFKLERV
jgi:restriction system protein